MSALTVYLVERPGTYPLTLPPTTHHRYRYSIYDNNINGQQENLDSYYINLILKQAGYFGMINFILTCTSGSGWTRPRQIRMFPIKDVCVFVYFSTCTSICLSGACVGCQFWLLSLQIHNAACKLQILRELTDSKAT